MVKINKIIEKFTVGKLRKGGRNNTGRISIRGRSGGHKRNYRFVDFKRGLLGSYGRIGNEWKDSHRRTVLVEVFQSNGMISQIIKPVGVKKRQLICVEGYGLRSKLNAGDNVYCGNVKKGVMVHNLELYRGKGSQILRSGGTAGQVIRSMEGVSLVKLSSGSLRKVSSECRVTVGRPVVCKRGNINKAGRNRWLGYSSKVRGVAMNPVDHPHGGATSGGRCSVSATGIYSKCGGNKLKFKKR
jgi:large subunit ribosomal protein L2